MSIDMKEVSFMGKSFLQQLYGLLRATRYKVGINLEYLKMFED